MEATPDVAIMYYLLLGITEHSAATRHDKGGGWQAGSWQLALQPWPLTTPYSVIVPAHWVVPWRPEWILANRGPSHCAYISGAFSLVGLEVFCSAVPTYVHMYTVLIKQKQKHDACSLSGFANALQLSSRSSTIPRAGPWQVASSVLPSKLVGAALPHC